MSDIVREAAKRYRNWGRWGPDDELGTLNYITADALRPDLLPRRRRAASS